MVKFIADNCTWKELHGRGRIVDDILFIATIIDSFSEPLRKTFSRVSSILATWCRIIGKGRTNGWSHTCWKSSAIGGGFVTSGIATVDPDEIRSFPRIGTETRQGVRPRVKESHVARFTCRRRTKIEVVPRQSKFRNSACLASCAAGAMP